MTTTKKAAAKKIATAAGKTAPAAPALIADAAQPAANDIALTVTEFTATVVAASEALNAENTVAAVLAVSGVKEVLPAGTKLLPPDVAFKRKGNIYTPNPFDDIVIEPGWNKRNYDAPSFRAHIEFLKKSIEVDGVRTPLEGYRRKEDGRLVLTAGHCRLFAIYELRAEGRKFPPRVPFTFDSGSNAKERRRTMLLENAKLSLSPLGKARLFADFRDIDGLTVDQIAEENFVARSEVYRLLKLLELPEGVLKLIDAEVITVNVVEDIIKAHKGDVQAAADQILESYAAKVKAAAAAPVEEQREMFPAADTPANPKAAPADAKVVDVHPAAKAVETAGRNTTVAGIKLTREDVGATRTNLKLARSLAAICQGKVVERDGKQFMEVDLDLFNRLLGSLGVMPAKAADQTAETVTAE